MTLILKNQIFINERVYAPSSLCILESSQPDTAELLFNKTTNDAKRRFYNYARLAGQEEKFEQNLKNKVNQK